MEIVTAAYVCPIDQDPIPGGAMAFELGTIRAIGPLDQLRTQFPTANVREFPRHVILPGLVNAHCHIDLTNFVAEPPADLPRQRSEDGGGAPSAHLHWLIQAIGYKQTTPLEQLVTGLKRGLAQLLQAGTTTAGLICGYEGVWPLIDAVGLRAALFPEIFASGPGDRAQDRFESALAVCDEFGEASPSHLRVGLGPSAPYLLSRHLLRIASEHAKQAAIPLVIHAAESFAEMEFFFDSTGPIGSQLFPAIGWGAGSGTELPPAFHKTPIQYLAEIGFLDAAPAIVGAIHCGAADFQAMARHGCRAIFCPRANEAFGHGAFPARKFLDHRIPVALGTESTMAAADGNLWEEMRAALETTGLPAKTILQMATRGGAEALSWSPQIGTLTPGKHADFIVCDSPDAEAPFLYDSLIRQTTPTRVRHVVVGGQWLKSG